MTDIPAAKKLLSGLSAPSNERRQLQGAPSDFNQLVQLLSGAFGANCATDWGTDTRMYCSGPDGSSASLVGAAQQDGSTKPISLAVCVPHEVQCSTIDLAGDAATDIPAATYLLWGAEASP
jgi:hypothetical protein